VLWSLGFSIHSKRRYDKNSPHLLQQHWVYPSDGPSAQNVVTVSCAPQGRWTEGHGWGPASYRLNLARFDLVSIRLAVLCAERGSLAGACKAANMSKPSASQRLASLEATLGKQLFIRDHRGMRATEAGVAFVGHARTILNEVERMSATLTALSVSAR